jgi:eukaryotic-like serine/threonine-protein kinase
MSIEGEFDPGKAELTLAFRIESACERFEASWRAGERPDIESCLDGLAPSERTAMARELIALEVYWRRRAGERPDPAEYLARFPSVTIDVTRDLEPEQPTEVTVDRPIAARLLSAPDGMTLHDKLGGVGRRFDAVAWPVVPGYEILGELGRGGMGVVYKARQLRLNRTVAIKMILAGLHAGREVTARFLGEATVVAKLQHPNIVQIFHIEEHDGHPYFEMEFVSGGNLASQLDGTPRSPRDAARLVETLAIAMAEAHRQGVVHRDLKPSNILLSLEGIPKVADFGLAKLLDADSGLTRTDSVLGSPSYMSPEQAGGRAKEIGPASDLYAIGAILYELLTGRPPFRGETVLDTLQQVKTVEPVPPSRLVPGLPRDIETIALKCLEKDIGKRYASATVLAEDLRRFQADEPILARPVGWWERARRWYRRNPAQAASVAAVAVALLLGTAVSMAFAVTARTEASRARENELRVTDARRKLQAQLIEVSNASGLAAARQDEHAQALLWFTHAARLAADDPERQRLPRIRVRNWQRGVLRPDVLVALPEFRPKQDRYLVLEFHVSGKYLLALSTTGLGLLWDLDRDQPMPLSDGPKRLTAAAFSPDGRHLALGTREGLVEVRDFPSLRKLVSWDTEGERVTALTFSPDNRHLAVGDHRGARVWDVDRKNFVTPPLPHPGPVVALVFDGEGGRLVTVSGAANDQTARTFTIPGESTRPLYAVPHTLGGFGVSHGGPDVVAPRFVDDGRVLLTITNRRDLVWRNASTGAIIRTSETPRGRAYLTSLTVDPAGKTVAALWTNVGRVFKVPDGAVVAAIPFEETWFEDAAFSPSGDILATGGHDTTVKFWSMSEPNDLALSHVHHPLRHPWMAVRVRFSADGSRVAVAGWDGSVCVWQFPTASPEDFRISTPGLTRVALSPDGRKFLLNSSSFRNARRTETQVHEVDTGQPAGPPLKPGGIILDAAFSPDGRHVATACSVGSDPASRDRVIFEPDGRGGNLQFWDWAGGTRIAGPVAMPSEPRGLDYSPDGSLVAVTCADGWVILVNASDGSIRRTLDAEVRTKPYNANLWWSNGQAKFSPDGRRLMTWEMDPVVHVWDPTTGRKLANLTHEGRIERVSFGTDPNLMITCSRDSKVRVWDLSLGRVVAPPLQHPRFVPSAGFTPDGKRIETVSDDGLFRTWDWRNGRLVSGRRFSDGLLIDFATTPDRRWLVTTGVGRTLLSDASTGTPIAPPLIGDDAINIRVNIPANGRRAIVSGLGPVVIGYDLPNLLTPTEDSLEEILSGAELISCSRVMENLELIQLTPSEWIDRWESRTRRPTKAEMPANPDLVPSPARE